METHISLVLRLKDRNDQDAWNAFVARYGPPILLWSRGRFRAREDREDAVQDVLTRLVTAIRQYDPDKRRPGGFRCWLRTVAHHVMTDALQTRDRAAAGTGGSANEERVSQVPAPPDPWEREFDAVISLEILEMAEERVRDRVLPKTWRAYEMTVKENHKTADIARELGMPIGSVYQARHEIKELLKAEVRRLERQEMDEPETPP